MDAEYSSPRIGGKKAVYEGGWAWDCRHPFSLASENEKISQKNSAVCALQGERLLRGYSQLSFRPCPACLQRLLTLMLAAAEGKQDRINTPTIICPLVCGKLC
mgnify:CR=1 FL=1